MGGMLGGYRVGRFDLYDLFPENWSSDFIWLSISIWLITSVLCSAVVIQSSVSIVEWLPSVNGRYCTGWLMHVGCMLPCFVCGSMVGSIGELFLSTAHWLNFLLEKV